MNKKEIINYLKELKDKYQKKYLDLQEQGEWDLSNDPEEKFYLIEEILKKIME